LPALYDEPFADSSQIPTFLVSELARRHVTVSLSGDGGDELFAGYDAYQANAAGWRKMERLPGPARRLAGGLLRAAGPDACSFALAPFKPLLPAGYRRPDTGARLHRLGVTLAQASYEMIYRSLLSFWEDPAALLPGSAEPPTAFSDSGRHLRRGSFVERMMYLDAVSYLPDDILVKVDRASMGVSLEARCPLLDYRLFELAWRFPLAWKFAPGKGKLPLRRTLARYVPERLWERPKSGFGVPVGEWIRGPLREWAEDLLSEAALRETPALNPVPVRRRWREHLSGRFDWVSPLWAVLMFQAWRRAEKPPEIR
jgi:asparagine synthase (glutamine-hydrolysing)